MFSFAGTVDGTEMKRWEVERKAEKYKTSVGSAEPSQMSNSQQFQTNGFRTNSTPASLNTSRASLQESAVVFFGRSAPKTATRI